MADQSWFWTPEWQAMEAEADADIAAGRTVTFYNSDDVLAWLDALDGTAATAVGVITGFTAAEIDDLGGL